MFLLTTIFFLSLCFDFTLFFYFFDNRFCTMKNEINGGLVDGFFRGQCTRTFLWMDIIISGIVCYHLLEIETTLGYFAKFKTFLRVF